MKRFVLYALFVSYAFTLLSVDDQAHAVPLIAAHNAGAGAPVVQVPIAAQIPAQPAVAQNPWRSRAIMACIVASLLTAIITPMAITFSQKPQQQPCINADDDMTDQCYYVSIAGCGQCDRPYGTYVSCPLPGKNNGASVLNATRILLDPICGDSAQYCVEQKPCVEDGYICDSNYARDTAAWLSRECGIKRSQSKLSNKMLLRNNERFSKQKKPIQKAKKLYR